MLQDCDQLAPCADSMNLNGPVTVPRASLLSTEISDVSGIRTAAGTQPHHGLGCCCSGDFGMGGWVSLGTPDLAHQAYKEFR